MHGTIAVLTGRGPACDELDAWLAAQPAEVTILRLRTNQIAWARNECARRMVGDWILYVDADCVPPAPALPTLLDRGLPLVGGVVVERRAPFEVCAVKSLEPFARLALEELPDDGSTLPVPAIGTGCLLVRRRVFEVLPAPWFRCGQLPGAPDLLGEDLDFCLRAAAVGFPAHLDTAVRVGHEASVLLWPGQTGTLLAQWEDRQGGRVPYRDSLAGIAAIARLTGAAA